MFGLASARSNVIKKLCRRVSESLSYQTREKERCSHNEHRWQDLPNPIYGGQSECDLPIRICVYPSYGINVTNAPGVMIASYVSIFMLPF